MLYQTALVSGKEKEEVWIGTVPLGVSNLIRLRWSIQYEHWCLSYG